MKPRRKHGGSRLRSGRKAGGSNKVTLSDEKIKQYTLGVRMDKPLWEDINYTAKSLGITKTELLRRAFECYLKYLNKDMVGRHDQNTNVQEITR